MKSEFRLDKPLCLLVVAVFLLVGLVPAVMAWEDTLTGGMQAGRLSSSYAHPTMWVALPFSSA
jgi:hypothetical protein